MVRLAGRYGYGAPDGTSVSLADLFTDNLADQVHLNARDTRLIAARRV